LAQEWNKPVASLTLEALAVEGPGWAQPLFQELREGFLRLVNEIERITLENRRLAAVNIDSIRGTLDMLGGQRSNTYDATGRAESRERLPMKIDEVM
jgi:flagellar biosynthesis/type III secretory pathway chaperone